MKYWVNSNTGDYISENNGVYKLHLITRYKPVFMSPETIVITEQQFRNAKGFIPIKRKKLFLRNRKVYAPTLKGGEKGDSERYQMPTKADIRNDILRDLLGS